MTVYIAGPMTGYADENSPAFDAAKAQLASQGYAVVSPIDISRPFVEQGLWPQAEMHVKRLDLQAVMNCDAIYMLTGWEKSQGARAEHAVASWFGKIIMYEASIARTHAEAIA